MIKKNFNFRKKYNSNTLDKSMEFKLLNRIMAGIKTQSKNRKETEPNFRLGIETKAECLKKDKNTHHICNLHWFLAMKQVEHSTFEKRRKKSRTKNVINCRIASELFIYENWSPRLIQPNDIRFRYVDCSCSTIQRQAEKKSLKQILHEFLVRLLVSQHHYCRIH